MFALHVDAWCKSHESTTDWHNIINNNKPVNQMNRTRKWPLLQRCAPRRFNKGFTVCLQNSLEYAIGHRKSCSDCLPACGSNEDESCYRPSLFAYYMEIRTVFTLSIRTDTPAQSVYTKIRRRRTRRLIRVCTVYHSSNSFKHMNRYEVLQKVLSPIGFLGFIPGKF